MYEMKYLKEKDMPYFRRLAEDGKAIIIEIPDRAFFHVNAEDFRQMSGEVNRMNLEESLLQIEPALMEKSREGERMYQEILQMEKLLDEDPGEGNRENAVPAEQMKTILEELIKGLLQEGSPERMQG